MSRESADWRRNKGKIIIGSPLRVDPTVSNSSSIPTKFETVFNSGYKEKNAFCSRTHRFTADETEIPGPGAYHNPTTLEKSDQSVSRKGFGNMVSRDKRWYESSGPLFNPPGPGDYDPPSFVQLKQQAPSNRVFGTSQFVNYTNRSLRHQKTVQPGPGDYILKEPIYIKHQTSSSSFKSESKRPIAQYNSQEVSFYPVRAAQTIPVHRSQPRLNFEKMKDRKPFHESLPQAVFRSRVNREKHKQFASPGPGQYNTVEFHTGPSKPQSIFANTGKVDRFGNPVTKVTEEINMPGPGHYFRPIGQHPTRHIFSSFFLSNSERIPKQTTSINLDGSRVGPLDYNPVKPGKQSFHLNTTGSFMV